jgi:hypothetical protein
MHIANKKKLGLVALSLGEYSKRFWVRFSSKINIFLEFYTARVVNRSDSNRILDDPNRNPLKIYKIHMRIRIQ